MPVQHLGVGTCSEERSPTLRQRGGALTYGPGNGDRRDRHPWAAAAAAASAVGRVGGGRWGWGALGAAGGPRATLWLLMTATNGADDWQSAPAVGGTPAAATRSLPPWGGGGARARPTSGGERFGRQPPRTLRAATAAAVAGAHADQGGAGHLIPSQVGGVRKLPSLPPPGWSSPPGGGKTPNGGAWVAPRVHLPVRLRSLSRHG